MTTMTPSKLSVELFESLNKGLTLHTEKLNEATCTIRDRECHSIHKYVFSLDPDKGGLLIRRFTDNIECNFFHCIWNYEKGKENITFDNGLPSTPENIASVKRIVSAIHGGFFECNRLFTTLMLTEMKMRVDRKHKQHSN